MSDPSPPPGRAPGATGPGTPGRAARGAALAPLLAGLRRPAVLAGAAGSVVLLALPFYLGAFWLQTGLFAMSAAIGAIGLNLLTGGTGQLSMGHAFFLAVGAYGYVYLASDSGPHLAGLGLPTPLAFVGAIVLAGAAGGLFSPIAGRLRGTYLGIASLALIFIGQHVLFNAGSLTGGFNGRDVPPLRLPGLAFDDSPGLVLFNVPLGALERLWFLGLALLVPAAWIARGVLRGRPGRALNTIRDREVAAAVMGVPVARYRAGVFVLSSMYAGAAGALLALVFRRTVPEYFGMFLSLDYLAMIVIGGLGTAAGAVAGAVFVSALPQLLTRYGDDLPLVAAPGSGGVSPAEASRILYGAAVVAVVLFLPGGLLGLWSRLRAAATPRRGPRRPVPRLDEEEQPA